MKTYPCYEVTKGMAGWFAVKIWKNPEGFLEPYDTGDGRYALQADAILEAEGLAQREGIPFYPPKLDVTPVRQDVERQLKELIPGIKIIKL